MEGARRDKGRKSGAFRPKGLSATAAKDGGGEKSDRSTSRVECKKSRKLSEEKERRGSRSGRHPSVSPVSEEDFSKSKARKVSRHGSSKADSDGSKKKTSVGSGRVRSKASVEGSVSPFNKDVKDDGLHLRGQGKAVHSEESCSAKPEKKVKKPSVASDTERKTSNPRNEPQKTTGSRKEPKTELGQVVHSILCGSMDVKCPVNTKTIRIFISSTFTDTAQERNALMEHVYPKLKIFCKARGYEFQVVDMRWGVRDISTNMHMTTELCLREIKACQELSVGPNFVMLLSQKYGYCPLLSSIDAEEFEELLSAVPDQETRDFTLKWYRLDENTIPPAYVLQPVSTWIPELFNEEDETVRKGAQEEWMSQFSRLKNLFSGAAKVTRGGQGYHKYVQSVCELEINQGLMGGGNPARNCVWFHRQISGVNRKMAADCPSVAKYIDVSAAADGGEDPLDLQLKLKEKVRDILPTQNIQEYDISWANNGIDPRVQEHKNYLDQFCSDFLQRLQGMIGDSIKEFKSAHINNPLYEEVVQHTLFCQKKVEAFHGRKRTLKVIEGYIKSDRSEPLVIHGRSGSGKTSVVAMAARSIDQWLDGKARVFLRFLGTTPKSSSLRRLLVSLSQQMKFVYQVKTKIPQNMKELVALFPSLLTLATSQRPIVVILDALDQLSPDGRARQLAWLPRTLPRHVKFVISTLPDERYAFFSKLRARSKDPACFLPVPDLPTKDVSNILAKWLKAGQRTLQQHQMQRLLDAFARCPLPLFLKISFDEACRWKSYAADQEMSLQPSIRAAIDLLLQQVELQYGQVLVHRALSYLTAAVSGLTSNELEDILSCDDDVLRDVFQYWTPPIRRLPPLLWLRIRASLSSYLVDREANGVRVICWYHRQFTEAARDRYLSDEAQRKAIHSAIADYFLGKNSVEGDAGESALIAGKYVRLASIPHQPLKLSDTKYNLRKLHELPHHLIQSGRLDELKSEVLCNFHWLLSKIKAFSVRAVFDDLDQASAVTSDPDICAISETLRLAQDALLADPNQLASQLVGRLYQGMLDDCSARMGREVGASLLCRVKFSVVRGTDFFSVDWLLTRVPSFQHRIEDVSTTLVKVNLSQALAELVRQASSPPEPALIPSRGFLSPPGGKLVETLVGHTSGVYGLAATRNGGFAVTGSTEGTVKVWDLTNGSMLHSIEDVGEGIGAVKCCHDDQLIIVSTKQGIRVLSFTTGEVLNSLNVSYSDQSPPIVLAGDKGTKVVLFSHKNLQVYDALSGEVLYKFLTVKPVGQNCVLAARGDVVLCNSVDDENSLKVISASTYRVSHTIKVFDDRDDDQFLMITQIAMKSAEEVFVAKKMKVDLYSVRSGEKLRSYAGKIDDWIKNMHLSPDEGFLIFPKEDKVAMLDLVTGERKELLEHTDYTARVTSVSSDLVLTSCADNVVRLWDLTREDVPKETAKPETALRIYLLPSDARHVLTVGRLGLDNYVATMWDLDTCLPVRKVRNLTSNYLQVINERRAALRVGTRLAVVNLDSWKVVKVMRGRLAPLLFGSTDDIQLVNGGTELLTYSEDRKLLKIYDIDTGGEVAELRPWPPAHELRAFLVDPPGRVVVFVSSEEKGALWDVVQRKMLFKVERGACYERFTLTHAGFSPDGHYFVVSQRKADEKDWVRHPMVWDVHQGELLHDLRFEADTDTQALAVIDNERAISAHNDKKLVVWNLPHGTPTQVLQTSHSDCRIDVVGSSANLAFSYTEKTILVWDVEEGKQVASFTADKVTALCPIGDGRSVAVGCESAMPLVLLTLRGEGRGPDRCPQQGTKAMAGTDLDICFEGVADSISEADED